MKRRLLYPADSTAKISLVKAETATAETIRFSVENKPTVEKNSVA